MPKFDVVPARILASRVIASLHPALAKALELQLGPEETVTKAAGMSLALFTADCDDVGYIALDEATKQADVRVIYAASFFGGAANASMPLAGEFIGMLAAPNPADATAGLQAAINCYTNDAAFHYADDANSIIFLDHLITSAGSYLSCEAGIETGSALAYLIAPPLEAILGIDAALKAAGARLVKYFPPPTPTNFSGAWLAGDQADCRAACAAFRQAVLDVAERASDI